MTEDESRTAEPTASDVLRQRIEHELKWPAIVPEHASTHELSAGLAA